MLSLKLMHMAGETDLDGTNPSRATSPAGSALTALQCVHQPAPTPGL